MNTKLIFYLSSKTGACEKALRRELAELNLNLRPAVFATEPKALGAQLMAAFDSVNIVFIVGGLDPSDKNGVENVMSKALADKNPDDLKKLRSAISSADGYLARCGGQLLFILPDSPDDIMAIMNAEAREYILSFCED